jgi:hypothetical protein
MRADGLNSLCGLRSELRSVAGGAFARGCGRSLFRQQTEADGVATAIAARKAVTLPHRDLVRRAMSMMSYLVHAALGANVTRQQLSTKTSAFHRKPGLLCRRKSTGRARGDSAMLDVTARLVVATLTPQSWSITSLPKAKREPAFRPIANLANFSSSAHRVLPYYDRAFCVSAPCAAKRFSAPQSQRA